MANTKTSPTLTLKSTKWSMKLTSAKKTCVRGMISLAYSLPLCSLEHLSELSSSSYSSLPASTPSSITLPSSSKVRTLIFSFLLRLAFLIFNFLFIYHCIDVFFTSSSPSPPCLYSSSHWSYSFFHLLSGLGIQPDTTTAATGAVNVAATFIAVYLIDRAGRRPLLVWGSIGMMTCLVIVGALVLGK